MKKEYEDPSLEIIDLDDEDIVTASGDNPCSEETEIPGECTIDFSNP